MAPSLPIAALSREAFASVYQAGPDAAYALVSELVQQIGELALLASELLQQNQELAQQNLDLSCQIEVLSARLQRLEDWSSKDSRTSNQPPSSDGFKRPPRSLRPRTERKPGGQPGHEGKTLERSETPDVIVVHEPKACSGCGHDLGAVASEIVDRRQVFDLPPLRLVVTEHQRVRKTCPCCRQSSLGEYPTAVAQPVQYGPRLQGLGVYLQVYQLLPFDRTSELIETLFGAAPSKGTLSHWIAACAAGLKKVEEGIREALVKAPVVHCDETGSRVEGKLWWLHGLSTSLLTTYAIHRKRGREAMEAIGLLGRLEGRAIHDGWASYFKFDCAHALCNAHHLRELTFLVDRYHLDWADRMIDLLVEGHREVQVAKARGETALEAGVLAALEARYTELLDEGFQEDLRTSPAPGGEAKRRGRPKQSPAKNLLDRLSGYRNETLMSLHDFRVPFDNNQAERDLRMMKVQQKISGSFRSEEGAQAFCRVRGYLSTLHKQGLPLLEALRGVMAGSPLLPSLSP